MQPPDENGNEWIDDPTPSGREIAEVMTERIRRVGWQKAWWSTCDGMDICHRYTDHGTPGNFHQMPGTYVFLAGYQDLDVEQAYLLSVCTQTDIETWVDYLSVYDGYNGRRGKRLLDVQWAQRQHRFFESAGHRNAALHWWIDLVDAITDSD